MLVGSTALWLEVLYVHWRYCVLVGGLCLLEVCVRLGYFVLFGGTMC